MYYRSLCVWTGTENEMVDSPDISEDKIWTHRIKRTDRYQRPLSHHSPGKL